MRRPPATIVLLLASLALASCKKASALEVASEDLPEGEKPLDPGEVRAHVMRENAKTRKANRNKPGANQVNARNKSQTNPPTSAGGASPAPTPSPSPTPSPTPTATADDSAWRSSLVRYDGAFIVLLGRVEFDAKGEIQGKGKKVLDDVAKLLAERPGITLVEVQGHVHGRTKGDVRALTQGHADAVRTYLIGQGVEDGRLGAVGYGSDMPIDTNRTEDGRRANTRVELIVKSINGSPTGS